MKVSVSEKVSSDTYQKLYQKGFRAGRKYESSKLLPVTSELEASNELLRGNIQQLMNDQADERVEWKSKKRLDVMAAIIWTIIGTWVVSVVALIFMPALFLVAGVAVTLAAIWAMVKRDR